MKRLLSSTIAVALVLVGLGLLVPLVPIWSAGNRGAEGSLASVANPRQLHIARLRSAADEGLFGSFKGQVELDWIAVGVYSDPLASPTPTSTPAPGEPSLPPPVDLGVVDLALVLTQSGNSVSGFVDLEHTLIYTAEATIMATPVGPTPLPGTPTPAPAPLKIGPRVSGTFDGSTLRLESERFILDDPRIVGVRLQRQFRLTGNATWRAEVVLLEGEFRETVWGYAPEPLTIVGSFTLSQALFPTPTPVSTTSPSPGDNPRIYLPMIYD